MKRVLIVISSVCLFACKARSSHQETEDTGSETEALASTTDFAKMMRMAEVWEEPKPDVLNQLLNIPPLPGKKGYQTGQEVECEFIHPMEIKQGSGVTPKFFCKTSSGDKIKVKYGAGNGEVFAGIAGTRLLSALGFYANRNYSIKVKCKGCPKSPGDFYNDYYKSLESGDSAKVDQLKKQKFEGVQFFDPVLTDTKPVGIDIDLEGKMEGFSFYDLFRHPHANKEVNVHRESLALLVSMLGNIDTKQDNQRVFCAESNATVKNGGSHITDCRSNPKAYVMDMGFTFGFGWKVFNSLLPNLDVTIPSKFNFEEWSKASVWTDKSKCKSSLAWTAIFKKLNDQERLQERKYSQASVDFLSQRYKKLTNEQKIAIFAAARPTMVKAEPPQPNLVAHQPSEWVALMDSKFKELEGRNCPTKDPEPMQD